MIYTIDQDLEVKDTKDGKKYHAKVVNVYTDKEEVKIHFVNWHNRYDEILPFNSDRISMPSDPNPSINTKAADEDSQDSREIYVGLMERLSKETIGNLLRQAGPVPKTVLSTFSERVCS